MMTVFLWILLALAVLTLVAIGSPIRFGAAASFGKSRPQSADFRISYIHPILFRYEYSSESRRERAVVFGFVLKKKADKGRKDGDDGRKDARFIPAEGRDGRHFHAADERSGSTGTDGSRFRSTGGPESGAGPADSQNHRERERGGGRVHAAYGHELLGARALRFAREMWENPLWTRLMNGINDFRGHSSYKFISDRVLRKKTYRWLRRSFKSILSSMRFERFKLRAKIGFRDPARVGKLYGYFTAAHRALALRNGKVVMNMEPVFTEECLEADIVFAGGTTIARILSGFIAITLTFPYWRVYKVKKRIGNKR